MKITDFTLRAPENTSIGTSGATGGVTISNSATSNWRIAATTSNTAVWVPPDAVSIDHGAGVRDSLTAHVFPIIAHRGDINSVDGYPENTLEAMVQAVRRGAHGIEFDVQRSSEGTWHVIHDTTVDRTTDGTGNVADKTDAQLAALNVDGGFGYDAGRHGTALDVPTLGAVLDAVVGYDPILYFDLKETTDAAHTAIANYIVTNGYTRRAIVICRSTTGAAAVKAVNADLETCVLTDLLSDVENQANIDRLLAEPEHIVDDSDFIDARQPKPVDEYREVTLHFGSSERVNIQQAWSWGIRMWLTSDLPEALGLRETFLHASGRWEPLTNGNAGSPELMFDANGDVLMRFVTG